MGSKVRHVTMLVAIAGVVTLAGTLFASPQHQEHHADQAVQNAADGEGTQKAAMCGGKMQEMMASMQEHMAMMQKMMAGTNGHQGMSEPGTGGGMMGTGGMREMMATPDPATITDPAEADQSAESLQAMAERMRAHLEKIQASIGALRARATELREGA